MTGHTNVLILIGSILYWVYQEESMSWELSGWIRSVLPAKTHWPSLTRTGSENRRPISTTELWTMRAAISWIGRHELIVEWGTLRLTCGPTTLYNDVTQKGTHKCRFDPFNFTASVCTVCIWRMNQNKITKVSANAVRTFKFVQSCSID